MTAPAPIQTPGTMARWYVVQTRPRAEPRAAHELANQGFEAFLPRYLKRRRHARKVDTVAMPLFPGYLFVAVDTATQRWRAIQGTIGVARLVAGEDGPIAVAPGIVEELQGRADRGGIVQLSARPGLARGDMVQITAGSFADRLGLFEGYTDQHRVAVLLELLGRQVRLQLDGMLVEKAA